MHILIEITELEIGLFLKQGKAQIDAITWDSNLNLSELLLREIDNLLVKNNLKSSDIDNVDIKTNISDNLTTVRIAQIVAKTFNYRASCG